MANLNTKYTPAEKPRKGRTAPPSVYGRKLHEMPAVDLKNDYHPKRTYKVTVNGKVVFDPNTEKKKEQAAPHVNMGVYKDTCRAEG